jgi:hypothetical protein
VILTTQLLPDPVMGVVAWLDAGLYPVPPWVIVTVATELPDKVATVICPLVPPPTAKMSPTAYPDPPEPMVTVCIDVKSCRQQLEKEFGAKVVGGSVKPL